ncbi:MAG: DNA cytosine methyltransferase, partial [Thermoguttaceae bacterium]|nr:DNA cytosine methyltransferase [Thermoguttaceae bacterium]
MRVVDLFAGSGGLSLGFQNAGFDVVAAFERWPAAAKCYRANF